MWWAVIGVTIAILLVFAAWVVWMNWMDYRTENTIGRQFDQYSGRNEDLPRNHRFRDNKEDDRDV